MGRLVGCRLWGRTESDTAEAADQELQSPRQAGRAQAQGSGDVGYEGESQLAGL